MVVVLANGSVVRTSTWEDSVGAVLECWLGGQAAGGAVADLLTGAANPSGKLAETIPVRLEDNPSYLNFPGDSQLVRYGEGLFIGYRAYDALGLAVSHPFGFGLSYTSFEVAAPDVVGLRIGRGRRPARRGHVHGDQHRQPGRRRGRPGLRHRLRQLGRPTRHAS